MRLSLLAAGALAVLAALGLWVSRQPVLPDWLSRVPGAPAMFAWIHGPAPAAPPRTERNAAPQVRAVRVASEDVPILLSGIGTVQAYNKVAVKSRVDGEITAIRFREGQDVRAGDVLAVIDPRPLQAQLAQQQAMLAKDHALLAGGQLDLNRYEALVAKNYASQQQVDQQRALVEQYRAQIRNDEAQIDYARTQLGYTSILSPIDGRTGIRQIDQGNYLRVGDGTTIVTVSQVQPISVVFTLSAGSVAASRLTLGEAKVPVAAYAADDTTLLDEGVVELIDNQVDQTTGTIKLKASFPNANLRLWPGNFVNGRITVETRKNAATVPRTALLHGPRGDFVFVLKDDSTVEIRNVRAGQNAEGRVLVERGLRPGERVVSEGQYRLENGTRVELLAPPPEREERPASSRSREPRPARSPS
jgi:multidrug efflux system membrane fusion protein